MQPGGAVPLVSPSPGGAMTLAVIPGLRNRPVQNASNGSNSKNFQPDGLKQSVMYDFIGNAS